MEPSVVLLHLPEGQGGGEDEDGQDDEQADAEDGHEDRFSIPPGHQQHDQSQEGEDAAQEEDFPVYDTSDVLFQHLIGAEKAVFIDRL